jgi:protein ImuB
MKRIASIWLPHLAIERWARTSDSPPDSPIVLTVEGTHGPIIHAVTKAAAERCARAGARLTDARALDPALVAMPADPAGDGALMERLAHWAARWSPLVEVDGDGLRLDVTGVAHLFGGEAALIADMQARFAALGFMTRIAIAPTAAAAWALARFSPSPRGGEGDSAQQSRVRGLSVNRRGRTPSPYPLPAGKRELLEQVTPLSVAALRLDPDTARTLERLGLKTIGALMNMPRLALARRFRGADNVVDALDRMFGRKQEPLTATPDNPPPRATLRLEEPATHSEAASQALERLIPKLVRQLERRRLGARRLTLAGFRVDGSVAQTSVATVIASREPKHLARLLADKAASLNPEFGFDAFALTAEWAESLGAAQDSLVEEPSGERDIARLIDRLSVKLGTERVLRPRAHESHLPERASGWVSAINPPQDGEGDRRRRWRGFGALHATPSTMLRMVPLPVPGRISRPQRLLDRPEAIDVIYATPEGVPRRFIWRRAVHDIARVEGPERIAPEWWRSPSSARLRDYYQVEDGEGRRYWIYREGLIGDGRGGAPNWFMHGLFG